MAQGEPFSPETPAQVIAHAIQSSGYAIIRDAMNAVQIAQLKSELQPHLDATPTGSEAFMGFKTKRFGALMSRCPQTHEMLTHPLLLGVVEKVLGPYCAKFQLNYTGVMYLQPGEKVQVLHRDDGFYPFQTPRPPLLLATMWAVTDFTRENGATCLVPGSHLWEDKRRPLPEEIVQAVMPAGSVLLYLASTLHGGGANQSNAARCGLALHYALAWLRQEENQYLTQSLEQARKLPRRVQELMGFDLATVNLGFVDHRHPNDVLNNVPIEQGQPLGPQDLFDKDNAIQRLKVTETAAVGRTRFDVVAQAPE